MSNNVDERVIQMSFDNSNFEQNVKQSMNSLEGLNQNLNNLEKSSGGLEAIKNAASKIPLDKIAAGVEQIQSRFSVLGIAGMTAISRITNSVMNLGSKLTSWFTNGIISGGISRATKLENARFQMEGLLKDTEKVDAVMKNVSASVDGTAYGLDAAASVASQLVATGYEAGEPLQNILHSIAGVAAMTNSSYEEIGQIYTTISGNGRLMSEQLLQFSTRGLNVAATLATAMGKSEEEIRDMVSKGKIDFETFANAMEEAFSGSADKANETLNGVISNVRSALGRIGALFVSPMIQQNGPLVKFFDTLRQKINDVKKTLDVFDENSNPFGFGIAKRITDDLNRALTEMSSILSKIDFIAIGQTISQGMSFIWGQGKNLFLIFLEIGKAFDEVFNVSGIINNIKYIAYYLGQVVNGFLSLSNTDLENLKSTFVGIFNVLKIFTDIIGMALSKIVPFFANITSDSETLTSKLVRLTSSFENFAVALHDSVIGAVETIIGYFSRLFDSIGSVSDLISKITTPIFEGFHKLVNETFGKNDVVEYGVLAILVYWVRKAAFAIRSVASTFNDWAGFGNITNTMNQLQDSLLAWENQLRWDSIAKIAGAVALLALSVVLLASVDSDKLNESLVALGALAVIVTMLAKAITGFSMIEGLLGKKQGKGFIASFSSLLRTLEMVSVIDVAANTIIKIAVAVLILAGAVKTLSSIDTQGLIVGLSGVVGLLIAIGVFAKAMGDLKIKNSVTGLIPMAFSLIIFAAAMKIIATMNWGEMARGLISIVVFVSMFVASAKILDDNKVALAKFSGQMILMSIAIGALAIVAKVLGGMEIGDLLKSVSGIAAMAAILVVAARVMSKVDVGKFGAQLIALSISVGIMAYSLKIIADLSPFQLIKSVIALVDCLAALTVAMIFMGDSKVKTSAILSMSFLVLALARSISAIGELSIEQAVTGVFALTAALFALAIAMKATPDITKAGVLDAATLSLLSIALALKLIAGIGIGGVLVALGGIAASFLVIGVAAKVMAPLLPAIMSLAGVFALLGAGAFLAGAGLALFATGLASIVATLLLGGSTLSGALLTLADAIPKVFTYLAEGVSKFVITIASKSGEIAEAIGEGMVALLEGINKYLPAMVTAGIEIIVNIMKGIEESADELVGGFIDMIVSLLEALIQHLPDFLEKGGEIIWMIISGIMSKLGELFEAGMSIIDEITAPFANIFNTFFDIAGNIINGLINGIKSGISGVVGAIIDMVTGATSAAEGELDINSPSKVFEKIGVFTDEGFIGGVRSKMDEVFESTSDMAKSAIEGMSGFGDRMQDAIGDSYIPSITPVMDFSSIKENAKNLDSILSNGRYEVSSNSNLASSIASSRYGKEGYSNSSVTNVTNNHWDFGNAVLNDEGAVANVTKNFLTDLARLGVM